MNPYMMLLKDNNTHTHNERNIHINSKKHEKKHGYGMDLESLINLC